MIYLLDTHIVLWWLTDNARLSQKAREIITEPTNVIFVSAANVWEIAIKRALGKLEVPNDLENAITNSHFQTLPITLQHALRAGQLPLHHADPFDRMLIAQAQHEGLTLMTHDKHMKKYGGHIVIV